jgi:hypothetical protein
MKKVLVILISLVSLALGGSMTGEMVGNAAITGIPDRPVCQFKGGSYEDVIVGAFILKSVLADFNGDGFDEAAALICLGFKGGMVNAFFLAILENQDGKVVCTRCTEVDIKIVQSVDYKDGSIEISGIKCGIDDPECCPRENTVMEIAIK